MAAVYDRPTRRGWARPIVAGVSPATHLIAAGTAASTTGLEPPGHQEEILNHKSREWDERDARQGRSGSGGEAGMPNHESRNSGSLSCISSFAAFLIKPRSIPGFLVS